MKNLMFMILLILCACGKPDSNSVTQAEPSSTVLNLQKAWTTSAPAWGVDFTNTIVGAPSHAVWTYSSGGQCKSNITVNENIIGYTPPPISLPIYIEYSGTMVTAGSVAVNPQPGDPPCAQFNMSWEYAIQSDGSLVMAGSALPSWLLFN